MIVYCEKNNKSKHIVISNRSLSTHYLFKRIELASETRMKIIFYLFISSLIPFIYGNGDSPHLETLNRIKFMAAHNVTINDVLLPVPNGYLGDGLFAFTYKGIFDPKNTKVAMKFTALSKEASILKEYAMYTYLNAIKNETVEAYGIPAIYYFGLCFDGSYYVMAMTLLDSMFQEQFKSRYKVMDILLIFREFIRIGKYIHSCGVRHNDIKFENFMFRKNQAFIIDFNMGTKLFENSAGGSIHMMSRRSHSGQDRCPLDDFESFLYFMCMIGGVHLKWFHHDSLIGLCKEELYDRVRYMKLKIHKILKRIENCESEILKNVYLEFAEHVLQWADKFPDYDPLYKMINGVIESQVCRGIIPVVSWLSPAEKQFAHNFLLQNPPPQIENIKNPRSFNSSSYPIVVMNFFPLLYPQK